MYEIPGGKIAMYEIKGTYRGRTEVLDTADTLQEARRLRAEYQLAFGWDWLVFVEHDPPLKRVWGAERSER